MNSTTILNKYEQTTAHIEQINVDIKELLDNMARCRHELHILEQAYKLLATQRDLQTAHAVMLQREYKIMLNIERGI